MIKDIFVFILACIIGTSCSNKTKRVNTNFNETHANKYIKPSKMSFASLGTFSNNIESALIPCYDLNIDKYIQKSKIKDVKIHMVTFDYDDEFFFKEQSERIPIKERDFIVGKKLILYKENKFYVEAR